MIHGPIFNDYDLVHAAIARVVRGGVVGGISNDRSMQRTAHARVGQELLGPNRGRYFLLTGQILSAREALELGVVNEVLPRERLMARAMEHAEQLLKMPEVARRYTRVVLTERMRRLIREGTGYGLVLEGAGIQDAVQNLQK